MSSSETQITSQRRLRIDRAGGTVTWKVLEFDEGRSYMLVVQAAGASLDLSTHFDLEQWAEFQKLISGVSA